jgi:hypothetical protein
MTITAATVINNARTLLLDTDPGGIRWRDAELIAWLNEAAAEIVRIHPPANAVNIDHPLVAGTRQRLPTNAVQLLSVVRNVAANGSPGRVVRLIDHRVLDNEIPDWHFGTPASEVKRFAFDPQDPLTFYVHPASNGTGQLTIVYSAIPGAVTTLGDNLPIPDIYAAPLTNYICYRAWMKQVGDVEGERRAASYLQLFNHAMGVKKATEDTANPNTRGV